jgi:cytochrome c-type biogenesis protein CcsB
MWRVGVAVVVAALVTLAHGAQDAGAGGAQPSVPPIGAGAGPAGAGPAGNQHPDLPVVSGEGAQAASMATVFGAIEVRASVSAREKHALAEGVDLGELRDLAVFHQGRVKTLDTLARETVQELTGRRAWFDLAETGDGSVGPTGLPALEKVKFDPMFTLLDLWIDPAHYADRALIGIDYLPLRREMVEAEFGQDAATAERWLRLGMVTPRMVDRWSSALYQRHAGEEQFLSAVTRAENAQQLYLFGVSNAVLVSPESVSDTWHHLAELEQSHPARVAALALGAAWRARDVAGVNAAAATLARELPAISPQTYPTGRRGIEVFYNRANAFEWGFWAYLVSFLMLVLAFGTGRGWLRTGGVAVFALALGLHALGFTLRCVIAERFAIQNQFESMTGVSLFAAVVGLVLMIARKQLLFGAAAAATGFLVLVTATQTGIPGVSIEREAAILNTSVLLKYHVTTVLTSYGLITLGMIVSVFYLAVHYAGRLMGARTHAETVAVGSLGAAAAGQLGAAGAGAGGGASRRTLKDLDTAQMLVLQLAFWTLAVGILLGAWWADHSWGRWWAFDPKETWALVTWIVYLIVIHVRFTGLKDRGLTTAWLSVIGFVVMLWTYFGVNLLLPGLHAYA